MRKKLLYIIILFISFNASGMKSSGETSPRMYDSGAFSTDSLLQMGLDALDADEPNREVAEECYSLLIGRSEDGSVIANNHATQLGAALEQSK